jgi:hypothetical protein
MKGLGHTLRERRFDEGGVAIGVKRLLQNGSRPENRDDTGLGSGRGRSIDDGRRVAGLGLRATHDEAYEKKKTENETPGTHEPSFEGFAQ